MQHPSRVAIRVPDERAPDERTPDGRVPDEQVPARRALALIGNIVALALFGLVLLQAPRLAGTAGVGDAVSGSGASVTGGRADVPPREEGGALLLVVVDALRDETARDGATMPNLAALAARGRRGTWWVDLLVPATIGSIEGIVEGRFPPPVRALQDFGARAATSGGWLQSVAERGEGVFVAGPDLWTERYGAWIDAASVEAGMPDPAWDVRVARAGLDALSATPGARVVVVHFGELDAVAHRYGAGGRTWREAARRVDGHLGRLVAAAGPERAIVVLADHGTTRLGGHAGGEAVVRRAPFVVAGGATGPGRTGRTGRMSRTAGSLAPDANDPVARPDELVRAALGVDPARAPATPEDRVSARAASPGPDPGGAVPGTGTLSGVAAVPGVGTLLGAVAVPGAVVLLGAAFLVLGGVLSIARGFLPGFLASAAFWSAAALTVTGRPGIGATLVLVALVSLAVVASVHGRERDGSAVASPQRVFGSAVPFLAGAVLAVASVAYAIHSVDAAPVFPGSTLSLPSPSPSFAAFPLLPLLLSTGFGLLGGAAVARIGSPRAAGTALAFALALAVHLGGETLSLSSIDVRLAHRVAGLVPGSGGVALAVPVALLRLVWPLVAVLVGYLLVRRRAGRAADGIAPIAFAVAFATCQLGAIAVYALCLASAVEPATTGLPLAAAGLGGLLREGVTTCLVFGVLVLAATDRRTDPDRSDPIRSDPIRIGSSAGRA